MDKLEIEIGLFQEILDAGARVEFVKVGGFIEVKSELALRRNYVLLHKFERVIDFFQEYPLRPLLMAIDRKKREEQAKIMAGSG